MSRQLYIYVDWDHSLHNRSAKYHEGTSALKLKGDQKEGKDTVMSLESLGDLTQHYTNLGNLGCVIVKGVQGYCSFINGIYRRVEDLFFEQRCFFSI